MSKKSQSPITVMSNYPGMWERITDCLGTKKTGEVAEILEISDSLVSDWKGDRAFPTLPKLFEITEKGGVTLDWLLTEKEPKTISIEVDGSELNLSQTTRTVLLKISEKTGRGISDLIFELVEDGLILRGTLLPHLNEEVRNEELKVILPVLKWFGNLTPDEQQRFSLKVISLLVARLNKSESETKLLKVSQGGSKPKVKKVSVEKIKSIRKDSDKNKGRKAS